MKSRARDQNGATLPLVALALLLLMGMAAMVVDIGNGRQIRRQAQGAVDAAALAAAVDYDGTGATQPAAALRAIEYVEDNGFTDAATDIQVSFHTNPATGEPCVLVRINNYPVATFFGRVLGATSLPVTAESLGCQTPNTTLLPGLLAGGTCSGTGKAFVLSGNDNRMEGSIHSNYDAKESGNTNTLVSGAATYNYPNPPGPDVSGSPPHWWDPASFYGPKPWPLSFVLSDYAPGQSRSIDFPGNYFPSLGDQSMSGLIPSGIYYTTGKWILSNITVGPWNGHTGATFVTGGGAIEISGDNMVIRPFDGEPQRLTFFAGWQEKFGPERCDSEVIKMSGNCNHFDGVIYAPDGKYTASGEGNGHDRNTGSGQCATAHASFTGGVLAFAINVNGNFNLYRGGNVPSGQGTPYLSS